ncbi:hypothetical protein CR513_27315, partial [Mucuna pruriens]
MEDNHFGQDRIKGHMQPTEPDLPRTYLKPSPQYQAPPFQQQQQQQRMSTQGNSPSLEDLMKQLAANNLEF